MTRAIQIGGRGFDCNVFLLKDPKSNAYDLVDAGHGLDFPRVLEEIKAITEPQRIQTVAITHEHFDHVNGISNWQTLGAKIATSPGCAAKLAAGHDPTSAQFGMDIPKIAVDLEIQDGDTLSLGGAPFETLLTPGHSPGSACYWHAGSGTLIAGDTLFANGGIGRYDFPDGNLDQLIEATLRLEKLPVRVLHSGHGPSMEGDAATRSVRGSAANALACR